MRIRILGCSGGIAPRQRTTTLLLGDDTLLDAGTGVGDLSLAQMRRIRRVVLTHSHLDHVCGLAFLADNLFDCVDHPVEVHATPETIAALRSHLFNWVLWPDFSELPQPGDGFLRFLPMAVGDTLDLGAGVRLQSFALRHTVPTVGYSLQTSAACFVLATDTRGDPAVWEYLNGLPRLDELMIEVAFPDEQAELGRLSGHFTPAELGAELRHLRHRPRLLLTHHKPGCEERIAEQCRSALRGWDYVHLSRGFAIDLPS